MSKQEKKKSLQYEFSCSFSIVDSGKKLEPSKFTVAGIWIPDDVVEYEMSIRQVFTRENHLDVVSSDPDQRFYVSLEKADEKQGVKK